VCAPLLRAEGPPAALPTTAMQHLPGVFPPVIGVPVPVTNHLGQVVAPASATQIDAAVMGVTSANLMGRSLCGTLLAV
jgi:hypothetical protein